MKPIITSVVILLLSSGVCIAQNQPKSEGVAVSVRSLSKPHTKEVEYRGKRYGFLIFPQGPEKLSVSAFGRLPSHTSVVFELSTAVLINPAFTDLSVLDCLLVRELLTIPGVERICFQGRNVLVRFKAGISASKREDLILSILTKYIFELAQYSKRQAV